MNTDELRRVVIDSPYVVTLVSNSAGRTSQTSRLGTGRSGSSSSIRSMMTLRLVLPLLWPKKLQRQETHFLTLKNPTERIFYNDLCRASSGLTRNKLMRATRVRYRDECSLLHRGSYDDHEPRGIFDGNLTTYIPTDNIRMLSWTHHWQANCSTPYDA